MTEFLLSLIAVIIIILIVSGKKIWGYLFYKKNKYCPRCKSELKKKSKFLKSKITVSLIRVNGPMRPNTVEEVLYCPKCRYEIMVNPFANPKNYR